MPLFRLYSRLLPALLIPVACAHANVDAAPAPPSAQSAVLGAVVPSFKRRSVQGPIFDTATAAGRVLVVDFFAGYCLPCQRELPALQRLAHQRRDVVFVGVSLDDDAGLALRQVARHRLTFPVVHDAGNVLAGRFRVTDLPATFVIDSAGRVAWVSGQGQSEAALERAVAAVAAKL